jgi:hypothetical protein
MSGSRIFQEGWVADFATSGLNFAVEAGPGFCVCGSTTKPDVVGFLVRVVLGKKALGA